MSIQLKVLEEGLVNHPAVGFGESGRKTNELRILLAKIEEAEVCDSPFGCLMYYVYLGHKNSLNFCVMSDWLRNMILVTILVPFHSCYLFFSFSHLRLVNFKGQNV